MTTKGTPEIYWHDANYPGIYNWKPSHLVIDKQKVKDAINKCKNNPEIFGETCNDIMDVLEKELRLDK